MFPRSSTATPMLGRSAHLGLALSVLLPVPADAQQSAVALAATVSERDALLAVLGLAAVFVLFAVFVAKVEGLSFMAPRTSKGIRGSVRAFCTQRCRVGGRCPMTRTSARAEDCPLWRYADSEIPLVLSGSPFEAPRLPVAGSRRTG